MFFSSQSIFRYQCPSINGIFWPLTSRFISSGNQYPNLKPGRYAKLSVSDNGPGIAEAHLNMIFDPYFTTKEPNKGTGLGLAVVHGIVKVHGGHVSVHSDTGLGTTFQVYLPLARQTPMAEPGQPFDRLPGGNAHILFVDDDPAIVKMQQQNLTRMGYRVTATTSSQKALETFHTDPRL